MTPGLFFWLIIGGVAVTTLAATAAQVLYGFAKHELEEYCERRGKREFFGRILDLQESMALGAETLRIVATTIALCAAVGWVFGAQDVSQFTFTRWLAIIALLALVMLLVNSWIPFAITQICAPQYLYHTWRVWWSVSFLVWPLMVGSAFVHELVQRATGVPDVDEDEEEALEDEIRSIVSEGERDGLLEADEREMIEGVIELDEKDVASIMTPRSKVDLLDVNTEWDDMLEFVVECGRTRIPVFHENNDNVIGVLYTKDLLRQSLRSESKRKPLQKLIRLPIFVPETKLLDEMLEQFQQLRIHLAIVRDEYGGMAGVVTIEDVLEEIVGEIVDETDNEQRDEIYVTAPGIAQIQGIAHVETVNEVLGLELPEGDKFDTIGGLVMNELKEIPRVGHELVIGNATFTIDKASRRTIEQLTVRVDDAATGNGVSTKPKRNSA